jgi:hypothetical protein
MLEQAQSQDITHQAATTFAASCNEFLTRPIVRSVSMFLGILAVTIAITNAVSLQWIIEATLTDIGPNSGLYSTAIQIAACLFFTSILVVFPKARKSVHGELSSLGILTFAVMEISRASRRRCLLCPTTQPLMSSWPWLLIPSWRSSLRVQRSNRDCETQRYTVSSTAVWPRGFSC